jgi:hypothetical protein
MAMGLPFCNCSAMDWVRFSKMFPYRRVIEKSE